MPTPITPETAELLCLLQWPGIGPVKALDLLRRKSPEGSLLETAEKRFPGITESQRETAKSHAARIIEQSAALELSVLGYGDPAFPPLLRQIPDPPAVLYVRGAASALQLHGIAVVGTRKVSTAGARAAKLIAELLARRGFNVVSGLALGVDMHAHLGALEAGGVTTAVLAHGLDRVAPSKHKELAAQIVDCGGAVVGEHPPGVPPRPAEFVRRNRLQSGLSLGSVVVESGVTGGSMHQARFTYEQGRRLFTVLAATAETEAELNEAGARHLIEEFGAVPLRGTGDLARALETLSVRPSTAEHTQLDMNW